jgi:hypothetical protein
MFFVLLATVLSVPRFAGSDYPFGIIKRFAFWLEQPDTSHWFESTDHLQQLEDYVTGCT